MNRLEANFWHTAARTSCIAAAVVLVGASAGAAHGQTWLDLVEYTKLKQRVGASLPTGAGGLVSQVEAGVGTTNPAYFATPTLPQFNGTLDPLGMPVNFIDGSGGMANGVSSHTDAVGQRFYGDLESVAPGANQIVLYEVNDWLENVLKLETDNPPAPQDFRVQNHSWIGTFATGTPEPPVWAESTNNVRALLRYDYLIETANGGKGMTAAVGLNNSQTPLPYLMVHSFNAIAVGKTDGNHSTGLTLAYDGVPPDDSYGPGRSKPEIVAPLPSTSLATGAVSGAATLLNEAIAGSGIAKNEVVKSVLLAGATKNEFPSWTRTTTQPLDDTFGAGELNIYNSYLMTVGGPRAGAQGEPASAVGAYGWDYQDFKGDASVGDIYYSFEVPAGSKAQELSIVLAWNAEVTDTDESAAWAPLLELNDLDLQFYNSTGGFLQTLVDESVSAVDNVEHLYLTNLGPGTYTLDVSGAAGWDYGLAWRAKTQFDQPSADFNSDGVVDGTDLLTWQRNLGRLVEATHAEGDADGDGDVDAADLAAWNAGLIAVPLPQSLKQAAAVPEPTGLVMALATSLGLWRVGRRNS